MTNSGDFRGYEITTETTPPMSDGGKISVRDLFADSVTRASGTWVVDSMNPAGKTGNGYVLLGSSMYAASFTIDGEGNVDKGLSKVGGGWAGFIAFETSRYREGPSLAFSRTHQYALKVDGRLFRWTTDDKGVWRNPVSFPGFSAVKSMALISQTRTYDTFLANTRGGALYTIHLPTSSPLKPVVKKVRGSTWQGFESLIAEKCGRYGTLLVAVDEDTWYSNAYAVGHANGAATVIQGLGRVLGRYEESTFFRQTTSAQLENPLFGE